MKSRFYIVITAFTACAVASGILGFYGATMCLLISAFATWVCLQAYYADTEDIRKQPSSWLKPRRFDPHWEYRWSKNESEPTIFIRNILTIGAWKLDWHVIVAPDALEAFHSHPGTAWRLILWGGYVEELFGEHRRLVRWMPLKFGRVLPSLTHRVAHVYGRSYSLWLRGPKTHETLLVGSGWRSK